MRSATASLLSPCPSPQRQIGAFVPITAGPKTIEFAFPEVHSAATLKITFHRTLRVPDNATTYDLPPSLGALDIRATRSGDAVLPLWQSEATWMDFTAPSRYPFLVKVGIGGINAVTGEKYTSEPDFVAEDYFEVPTQPWLDGFRVDAKTVRQFVAMPLGDGYSAAEQLTGSDDGLIRFSVIPLKAEVWQQRQVRRNVRRIPGNICPAPAGMGLGAGGSIKQSIATPIEPHENWELNARAETRLRLVNSAVWQELTGELPHREPLTIDEYTRHGFPWFTWYDDSLARQGRSALNEMKTVRQIGEDHGAQSLPDNTSFTPPTPHIVGGA
jgi:hypothetical protein